MGSYVFSLNFTISKRIVLHTMDISRDIRIINASFFFNCEKLFYGCFKNFFCSFRDAQKDQKRYAIWLENVNKNSPVTFVPTKQGRICSEHFSLDMFEEGGVRVILKPFAVPTIFPHSQVCMRLHILSIIKVKSLISFNQQQSNQGLTTCKQIEQVTPNVFQCSFS